MLAGMAPGRYGGREWGAAAATEQQRGRLCHGALESAMFALKCYRCGHHARGVFAHCAVCGAWLSPLDNLRFWRGMRRHLTGH